MEDGSSLTIDRAGAAQSLGRSHDLRLVSCIWLRLTLVGEIDGGIKGKAIARGASDIWVVVDRSTSLNDCHRYVGVLAQSVGNDES